MTDLKKVIEEEIGLAPEYLQIFKDNYVNTVDDLKKLSGDDLEDIIENINDRVNVYRWQKGKPIQKKFRKFAKKEVKKETTRKIGDIINESSSNEEEKSSVEDSSSENEQYTPIKLEKKEPKKSINKKYSIPKKNDNSSFSINDFLKDKNTETHKKEHSKVSPKKTNKPIISENKIDSFSSDISSSSDDFEEKSANKKKQAKPKSKKDYQTKIPENLSGEMSFLADFIASTQTEKKSFSSKNIDKCEWKIKPKTSLRESKEITLSKLGFDSDKSHDCVIAFDSVYENEIKSKSGWKPPVNNKHWKNWSDKSGKNSLEKSKIDDLKELGVCCSKWKWVSQWIIDGSSEDCKNGWTISDPSSGTVRRKKWIRVRILDVSESQMGDQLNIYKLFQQILKTAIWKTYIISENKSIITDMNELTNKYQNFYKLLLSTTFITKSSEEDLPDQGKLDSDDNTKKLEHVFNNLLLIYKIINGTLDDINDHANLIESTIKSIYSLKKEENNETLFLIYTLNFLNNLVMEYNEEYNEKTLISLDILDKKYEEFKNETNQWEDNLILNPINLILSTLKDFRQINDTEEVSKRDIIVNKLKDLYEVYKKWLTHYHNCNEIELFDIIGKCFQIATSVGNIINTKVPKKEKIDVLMELGNIMTKSITNYHKRKRSLYPENPQDWIEEDWDSYNKDIIEILELEIKRYIPKLTNSTIFYIGKFTICKIVKKFSIQSKLLLKLFKKTDMSDIICSILNSISHIKERIHEKDCTKLFEKKDKSLEDISFYSYSNSSCARLNNYIKVTIKEIHAYISNSLSNEFFVNYKVDKLKQESYINAIIKKIEEIIEKTIGYIKKLPMDKHNFEVIIKSLAKKLQKISDLFIKKMIPMNKFENNFLQSYFELEKIYSQVPKQEVSIDYESFVNYLGISQSICDLESDKERQDIKTKFPESLSDVTECISASYQTLSDINDRLSKLKKKLMDEYFKRLNGNIGEKEKNKVEWSCKTFSKLSSILSELLPISLLLHDMGEEISNIFYHSSNNALIQVNLKVFPLLVPLLANIKMLIKEKYSPKIILNIYIFLCKLINWKLEKSDRIFVSEDNRVIMDDVSQINDFFNFFTEEGNISNHPNSSRLNRLLCIMTNKTKYLISAYKNLNKKSLVDERFVIKKGKIKQKNTESENMNMFSFLKEEKEKDSNSDKSDNNSDSEANDDIKDSKNIIKNEEVKVDENAKKEICNLILTVLGHRNEINARNFAEEMGFTLPYCDDVVEEVIKAPFSLLVSLMHVDNINISGLMASSFLKLKFNGEEYFTSDSSNLEWCEEFEIEVKTKSECKKKFDVELWQSGWFGNHSYIGVAHLDYESSKGEEHEWLLSTSSNLFDDDHEENVVLTGKIKIQKND